MAWIEPKTNWVNGDYFNLEPDYTRIKGNIEHLIALSKEMYPDYPTPILESVDIMGFPNILFFNNVVNATKSIMNHCYTPIGAKSMRIYSSNGVGWNASELNAIEENHRLLYDVLMRQRASRHRLPITLGGVTIGN
jgi:hypothetical protein